MKTIRHLAAAVIVLTFASDDALPVARTAAAGPEANAHALAQGLQAGLQAYASAADAYAAPVVHVPAVAVWAGVLAALVVLVEWMLGRGRRQPGG